MVQRNEWLEVHRWELREMRDHAIKQTTNIGEVEEESIGNGHDSKIDVASRRKSQVCKHVCAQARAVLTTNA